MLNKKHEKTHFKYWKTSVICAPRGKNHFLFTFVEILLICYCFLIFVIKNMEKPMFIICFSVFLRRVQGGVIAKSRWTTGRAGARETRIFDIITNIGVSFLVSKKSSEMLGAKYRKQRDRRERRETISYEPRIYTPRPTRVGDLFRDVRC